MIGRSLWLTALSIAGWVSVAPAQNFGMPPGERYFRLDWAPPETGRPVLEGKVTSIGGLSVAHIQVQVDELGPTGQVTRTASTMIPGQLTSGSLPFTIPVSGTSATYRVYIVSFESLEAPGGAQR